MDIRKQIWGTSPDGKEFSKYTITNASGAYVELSEVGAGIVGIYVPDKDGNLDNVVLSYEKGESYFYDGPCAGKCPGRYANRIARGHFTLDGKQYTLPINNAENHLHGGPEGFMNKVWESRVDKDNAVEFMYFSEDGECGYPGNLKVVAHYEWTEDNELILSFTAQCDAPTVVNLTNHVYFNLDAQGDVLGHILKLNASEYLPTHPDLIPVGDSEPVAGTAMDFTNAKTLGQDIRSEFAAVRFGKGFDNCYIIDGATPGQISSAAQLWSDKSGRCLEVLTTQPGVQVYTGNYLSGCPAGPQGRVWNDYDAVAIECQHYPDSPNHPEYPSTELRPGDVFKESIIWSFTTLK